MTGISVAGLIGAALGSYMGWLDWKILKGVLQAAELKNRQAGGNGGFVARHKSLLNGLMFVVSMIGFPVIGYLAGAQIAG